MYKKIVITLLILLTTILSSCEKPKEEYDMELPYYEYLSENNPLVTIKVKDFGIMKLELFKDVAEISVLNFIKYIEDKAYTNSTFHRIIKGFMIQGGIVLNTYPPIKGEFLSNGVVNNLKHHKGVISMARTAINNSATSQFFIVHKDSPHLDGNYASFGGLVEGFDVLDKIANTNTNAFDAPLNEVLIESITIDLRGFKK